MADIIYRFDNTPWGGNHNRTLTTDEMPNFFPIGEDVKQDVFFGDGGKTWKYDWYRKQVFELAFDAVGTAIAATMGSIAREGVWFRWYKDIDNDGGTGTMVFLGEWSYNQLAPDLVEFSFSMREAE